MIEYGKYEYFVMQVLYVCVLCASFGSSQCCIPHEKEMKNSACTTLFKRVINFSFLIFINMRHEPNVPKDLKFIQWSLITVE